MTTWSEGYVTATTYEGQFFVDLTPAYLRMALLLHGEDLPHRKKNEPLRYLELGYGQGVSLNVHSAAVAGDFWGTDFNPDHTLIASSMAQAAGLDVQLHNVSFAELDARGARGELPQFDIITMHGIWSWISDENRQHILNIIHRNLKMGGIVYVSYNALPGWAASMPVRDVLTMYTDMLGNTAQDIAARTQSAYSFARALAQAGAGYFVANPQASQRLEQLEGKSLSYVTHEYMNRHWRPFYFADVAGAMGMAKCTFVSSTRFLTQLDICLPEETRPIVNAGPNVIARESLRDFCLNQQFRADIFIKGSTRLSPAERIKRVGAMRVALACQQEAVNLTISSPQGAVQLKEDIYLPVLAALADNTYSPKTIEQLEDHPLLKDMASNILLEAVTVLAAAGYLHPAQKPAAAQQAACNRLNRFLCEASRAAQGSDILASPVLGGGLRTSRVEQLFLLSCAQGETTAQNWAEDALNALSAHGNHFQRDGKNLSTEEALPEVIAMAEMFAKVRLPYLAAMGIVPQNMPACSSDTEMENE